MRLRYFIWLFLAVVTALSQVSLSLAQESASSRPNFLLIISDDQRYDALRGFMPQVESRIFDRGVEFDRTYVTTSICCPSRVSMFTGLYACRHLVKLNDDRLIFKTIFDDLKSSGYKTGIVGKYLNSWPGRPRPEFDFWAVFPYGSMVFNDPIININGELKRRKGYITDLLRDQALAFIDEYGNAEEPFALVFSPNAPHNPAIPSGEDRQAYSTLSAYRPPNWGDAATAGKPAWLKRAKASKKRLLKNDAFRVRQLRTLLSLDRAIGTILDRLEERNLLNNTVIMYISDNGIMWGEFGLESKAVAYEPAVRVPFAISYPPLTSQHRLETRLTSNIDIAPTIYDMAGLHSAKELDGLSLAPILKGESTAWRSDLLIEGWNNSTGREPFIALHSGAYKYIENKRSAAELYNVLDDPYEMTNLATRPAYKPLRDSMKSTVHQKKVDLRHKMKVDLARLRAQMSARLKGKKHLRVLAARALHKARSAKPGVDPAVRMHLAAVFGADSREVRDPFQDYDDYQ